jgi:hypothetical protein
MTVHPLRLQQIARDSFGSGGAATPSQSLSEVAEALRGLTLQYNLSPGVAGDIESLAEALRVETRRVESAEEVAREAAQRGGKARDALAQIGRVAARSGVDPDTLDRIEDLVRTGGGRP